MNECLSSVLAQDYSDWECLLIDDGSTDQSSQICDAWAEKDSRFRVFHTENHGVAMARNLGLAKVNGGFVTFVDGDDFVAPIFLSTLVSAAKSSEEDLIVGGYKSFGESGFLREYVPTSNRSLSFQLEDEAFVLDLFEKNLLYGPWGKLYRRDLIIKANAFFEDYLSYGEDLLFNCLVLGQTQRIVSVAYGLYYYRKHGEETLSTTFRANRFSVDYPQWKKLYSLFESKGFLTNAILNYLANRLWGIVYDGIFLFPQLTEQSLSYLRSILSIPEITFLKSHQTSFICSAWIKSWILHRRSLSFYFYFKLIYQE